MFDLPLPIHQTAVPRGFAPLFPSGVTDPNLPFALTLSRRAPADLMSGRAAPLVLARFATLAEAMQGAIDHAEGMAPDAAPELLAILDRDDRLVLAGAASEIFTEDPQVEVLTADWSTLRDKGPFSLLFLDPSAPEDAHVDAVADLVEPGGIVVLDDFEPCQMWPPISFGRVDTLREAWLTDERFVAVEVMVAPDASAVIAMRL